MTKKILASLILALALMTAAFAAPSMVGVENAEEISTVIETEETAALAATSGTCGDNLTWTLDDEGTLTISGTGTMTDYSWNGTPWYSSRASIKKVVISNGVTRIGQCAFYDCSNLASIKIPECVTYIGNNAFDYCISLVSIEIPESVTYIGHHVFCDCTNLVSITVDSNNANYASDEKGVLFNKNKTTLIKAGNNATNYIIPNSVTRIGDCAFSDCTSLARVEIPVSVTSIGKYSFYNCSNLASIEIPASVTSIGVFAFSDCTSLTSVEISQGVTIIGACAFYNCTSLTSIEIPASVTSIGMNVLYNCKNLTIYGYAGSTAETYAKSNSISFEYIRHLKATSGNGKYTVSAIYDGSEITGKIAAAMYNDSGKLIEIHLLDAAESVPVEFENTVEKGNVRFMWLSESDSLTPMCKNITIDI